LPGPTPRWRQNFGHAQEKFFLAVNGYRGTVAAVFAWFKGWLSTVVTATISLSFFASGRPYHSRQRCTPNDDERARSIRMMDLNAVLESAGFLHVFTRSPDRITTLKRSSRHAAATLSAVRQYSEAEGSDDH
jgi:hypothetical protein